ncbi:6-pyruvoyl-tetrahydropterin synthase-related protein, partial [Candidatus Bathyarchaeota archaeon]|nr:6-pyruvoyl-tetrahydropterin synthase-related protein [Candidatus Bathyarchaeota archaeon]
MKLFIIIAFSSYPILLYRLGRVLGRRSKGATAMAILFSLTPLNVFFLFNGYFVLVISLAMMFIFLTEFFKYVQNRDKTSFLVSTAMLAIISLTYHRALYFILFILLFYILLKVYRRQVNEAVSVILIIVIGVSISSFWLLPASIDMLTFKSSELYQSLILVASHNGISFQLISVLFIIPYSYLVFKRMKAKRIKDDRELSLFLSLIFFIILSLGPYGLIYYIIPFSSSQRVEITLLITTFIATILASSLFDEKVVNGRRTFSGILLSSLVTMTLLISVFLYPQAALSLETINFTYAKGEINDSLSDLVNDAYIKQQVFLGKRDEDFSKALQYISNDKREGKVTFYSNRSQTVDMFYYYAMLPTSGKSTPQGVAPEGEGDLKWGYYTQHIIWHANETLLKLSGTRWVISNYQLEFRKNNTYASFGQYRIYELEDVNLISGSEGYIYSGIGEMLVVLDSECKSIVISQSYYPRWHAFDQNNNELKVESTEYGFMKITSIDNMKEVHLFFTDTIVDTIGRAISIIGLILFT